MANSQRVPTLLEALFPIFIVVVLLGFNLYVFGGDGLEGSIQFVLIIAFSKKGKRCKF